MIVVRTQLENFTKTNNFKIINSYTRFQKDREEARQIKSEYTILIFRKK